MESAVRLLALLGREFIEFIWFPIVVWTLLSLAFLLAMKLLNRIHSQYHYHIRLALLLGLPAGILAAYFIELLGTHLYASSLTDQSLKFVSVVSPIEVGVAEQVQSSSFSVTALLYTSVTIAVFSGMIFLLIRYGIQWKKLLSIKTNSLLRPVHRIDRVNEKNLQLATSIRKPVQIGFSEMEIIPVTFGFLKPVILLPSSLKNSPEKMNLALRHELMHIYQNDFATHLLTNLIKIQFWFHPLVHLLSRQLTDYREMRCDSFVLSDETISKKEYASLLLEMMPMPNLDKQISVNMAQESSNLKKRVQVIAQQNKNRPVPVRSSLIILGTLFICTVLAMACTDIQPHAIFDEEELDLMTDVDATGERGYHQIIIFMGDEEQADRHEGALSELGQLQPEHVQSIEILKGEAAVNAFGSRASEGVILINTKLDPISYNTTLRALGMEPVDPATLSAHRSGEDEDYFVVVENMPELIGGLAGLQQNIRYPETARRAGIEGRVTVQFIVNEQGDVENPQVIRGIGGGCDEEALRAVSQAKFIPGLQRGRPVRVQYSLPIHFRLSEPPQAENPAISSKIMDIDFEYSGNRVQGTVLDSNSGQPLAGANVVIVGTNLGIATDIDGRFTISNIDTDPSSSQLQVSYVGYITAVLDL